MANSDLSKKTLVEVLSDLKDSSTAIEDLAYIYPDDSGTELPVSKILTILAARLKEDAEQAYLLGLELWHKSKCPQGIEGTSEE